MACRGQPVHALTGGAVTRSRQAPLVGCPLLCRYFYIPARAEHRGLGGLFFDDMANEDGFSADQFTRDVGEGILARWAA